MPDVNLELSDAVELAELLTFLTDWLSGSQRQTLADSLDTFVGHPGCNVDNLAADLHRFVFLLGLSDGEQLFGEPLTMIDNRSRQHSALDRITRITTALERLVPRRRSHPVTTAGIFGQWSWPPAGGFR
jgi:hypothetical protein